MHNVLGRRRSLPAIWALAIAHAVLFALAFPPFDLWFVAFLAPAPLVWLAAGASTARGALFATGLTQFGMWLWLVRWIIPVTAVGYPFLALYMSIWPMIFVWILRRVHQRPSLAPWPMSIVMPIHWVGVEFFRGDVLFHGYPWYLLGHPLMAMPVFVQSADLFGTYFISFLTALVAGIIVDLGRARLRARPSSLRTAIVAALVIIGFNFIYGRLRLQQSNTLTAGPRVLAMQTNLPQSNKVQWSEEQREHDIAEFMAMTRAALAQISPPPDLIVWPETMVPGVGFEEQTSAKLREMNDAYDWNLSHLHRWSDAVVAFQRELNIPMIVGSEAWIETTDIHEGTKIRLEPRFTYNSAYLIEGQPPYQRYDKFFLTPFGETMPYISAWPWLERQFLTIGVGADLAFNLDSNPHIQLLQWSDSTGERTDAVSMAAPICFEDTVARFCRRMIYARAEKRGDLFINISNDGWFGESDADRKLHAQIARFRCIENRVPMVRSVNTGLSMYVDSAGRIQAAADGGDYGQARQPGWVLANVQLDARRTLYSRIGETFPILCLIATVLLLASTVIPGRGTSGAGKAEKS